jgi:hypothetical protein
VTKYSADNPKLSRRNFNGMYATVSYRSIGLIKLTTLLTNYKQPTLTTNHEIGKLKLNLGLRVGDSINRNKVKFKSKRNSFIKRAIFLIIIKVERLLEQISRRIGFVYQNCHSFGYLTRCINCNGYLAYNEMVAMCVVLERIKKEAAVACFNILSLHSQRTTENHGNRLPG